MQSQSVLISSLAEMKQWVLQWSSQLRAPCVVALNGEMGAGKTQLTQFLAEALGCQETVVSPTFAIHHQYLGGRVPLDHVDLFRVESEEDLESTGFWDLLDQPRLLVVEWAERIPIEDFPLNWALWSIRIERGSTSEARLLTVQCVRS